MLILSEDGKFIRDRGALRAYTHFFQRIHRKSVCFHHWPDLGSQSIEELAGILLGDAIRDWKSSDKVDAWVWVRLFLVEATMNHLDNELFVTLLDRDLHNTCDQM